ELCAGAIDSSAYGAALTPSVRCLLRRTGDLLDVGAGGGQIGAALRDPNVRWTAIEPSPAMRARLARFLPPPQIVAGSWEKVAVADAAHDTVLAATLPASFHT